MGLAVSIDGSVNGFKTLFVSDIGADPNIGLSSLVPTTSGAAGQYGSLGTGNYFNTITMQN